MYDKITNKLNTYIDDRFEHYRGYISTDISQGIAALAGLIALWTVFLLVLFFGGILMAVVIWHYSDSLLLGVGIVAALHLIIGILVFLNKKRLIEDPVYRITHKALNTQKEQEKK